MTRQDKPSAVFLRTADDQRNMVVGNELPVTATGASIAISRRSTKLVLQNDTLRARTSRRVQGVLYTLREQSYYEAMNPLLGSVMHPVPPLLTSTTTDYIQKLDKHFSQLPHPRRQ